MKTRQFGGYRRLLRVIAGPLALGILAPAASAEPVFFQGLGDLPGGVFESSVSAISADGSTVVGYSQSANGREAFRWTAATGMVGLGDLPGGGFDSWARGVSADGSVVVGRGKSSLSGTSFEAFRWTSATGMVPMGDLPGGSFYSSAEDVSDDGLVIVGRGQVSNGYEAFRWTQATGMVSIGDLPGGTVAGEAHGTSANGEVIVGYGQPGGTPGGAFRWTQQTGMANLGTLPGATGSLANACNADGSVVVGWASYVTPHRAFRWTDLTGMSDLGALPGGNATSDALDVSADGSLVTGFSSTNSLAGVEAFIWDEFHGIRNLRTVLANQFGLAVIDWWLISAYVSADGLSFAGRGQNPDGDLEAWIAHIPEPASLLTLVVGVALAVSRRSRQKTRA